MSIETNDGSKVDLSEINPREIHNKFSQTPEGKKLANKTRWSRYQNDLTKNEWQDLLGYDVNNLEHARLTYGITYLFIKNTNNSDSKIKFTPEEEKLLLLTAMIHDYPEGFTKKGDVTYELKTDQDEDGELEFISQIFVNTLGQENISISKEIKDILKNKDTKLGQAFNVVENIGYMRTGLIAWKKSKTTEESVSSNLVWLTSNTLSNIIPKITRQSFEYPPVADFLKRNQSLISDAFNSTPEVIFNKYKPEDQEKSKLKFNQSFKIWNEWISANSK